MSGRFADLADGGRQLAQILSPDAGAVVLAIVPGGVPGAIEVADALTLPLYGVRVDRGYLPRVSELPIGHDATVLADRAIIVIDDGVETGGAAQVVGQGLRELGAGPLTLAVPVCPRETEAKLMHLYDEIVAVERPIVRRSLKWHYTDFDVPEDAEALRRLADHDASLG